MEVNKKLFGYLMKSDLTDKQIKTMIEAYSGFICTTNKDYFYNQSYLNTYLNDFLASREKLQEKLKVLQCIIIPIFFNRRKIQLSKLRITINNAIVYTKGRFALKTEFNIRDIKSNKIEIEYLYLSDEYLLKYYQTDLKDKELGDKITNETNGFIAYILEAENGKI